MKAVLSLRHGTIPKNLNFRTLNPRIRQAGSALDLATERVPWPRRETPRIAGVSGFGISGTNAHVLIEEGPAAESPAPPPVPVRSAELLVLSAKTPEALRAAAGRLKRHVNANPEASLADLSFSLMTTRAPMETRLALAVSSREELSEALAAAATGEDAAAPGTDELRGTRPRVAFVFPGQGSQWLGMGRQLMVEEPAFAEALAECDRAVAAVAGWSVIEELNAPDDKSRMDRIDVVQPLLFAVSVALAALWRSWGIEPHVTVGHSQGEIAAACVAGALSLADGATIVCRRSALMRRVSGQGEMALVELSMQEAEAEIAGLEGRLGVAVNNGTRSTVLSGEPVALGQVLTKLEGRGVFCRRVKVDVASHSPQMDPLLEELESLLASVAPQTG
jgi:acyl transferase domain-containing protein